MMIFSAKSVIPLAFLPWLRTPTQELIRKHPPPSEDILPHFLKSKHQKLDMSCVHHNAVVSTSASLLIKATGAPSTDCPNYGLNKITELRRLAQESLNCIISLESELQGS